MKYNVGAFLVNSWYAVYDACSRTFQVKFGISQLVKYVDLHMQYVSIDGSLIRARKVPESLELCVLNRPIFIKLCVLSSKLHPIWRRLPWLLRYTETWEKHRSTGFTVVEWRRIHYLSYSQWGDLWLCTLPNVMHLVSFEKCWRLSCLYASSNYVIFTKKVVAIAWKVSK